MKSLAEVPNPGMRSKYERFDCNLFTTWLNKFSSVGRALNKLGWTLILISSVNLPSQGHIDSHWADCDDQKS